MHILPTIPQINKRLIIDGLFYMLNPGRPMAYAPTDRIGNINVDTRDSSRLIHMKKAVPTMYQEIVDVYANATPSPSEYLILLQPKVFKLRVGSYGQLLKDWEVDTDGLQGIITIPSNYVFTRTYDKTLVLVRPDKLWYAVVYDEDEFVILASK